MEMALRTEKAIFALVVLCAPMLAQDYAARHLHTAGSCRGTLRVEAAGIVYLERTAHQHHRWSWAWDDIQQLDVGDDQRVRLRSYRDGLGGRDERYEFELQVTPAVAPLRAALGARLIEHLVDATGEPLWSVPAKRLRGLKGAQGELCVYADRIVFYTPTPGESRTWRDAEIEFVSSAGPLEFSITSGTTTAFQLKQPLETARYQALWKRLLR
jgi:hypothetical protein